ncbi:uncharacterized protein [Clytia hemisphaerica]|uniref:uncharacterized protein n=1 Tax=Clytia hemisphaerica TaxID=252671 RepID=UPI0034D51820
MLCRRVLFKRIIIMGYFKGVILPLLCLIFCVTVLLVLFTYNPSDEGLLPIKTRQWTGVFKGENTDQRLEKQECPANKDQDQIYAETHSDEWLDRSNSKIFNHYKNSTGCPRNVYYKEFKEMLRFWMNIAKKLKIRYFLTDGSLLGAWRDGDIIPYDFDLDIRVHVDDLPKLLPMRQKKKSWNPYKDVGYHIYFTPDWQMPYEIRQRYSCFGKRVNVYEGECSFTDPPARVINDDKHIDIFIYQTYELVLQYFPSRQAEFYLKDAFPLVKCHFLNETTWCPRNPKRILDGIYKMNLAPQKVCKKKKWVDKNEK